VRQTEDDIEQIDKQITMEEKSGVLMMPGQEAGAMPTQDAAPAPAAPAPQGAGQQPQVTIGEIVPDDEKGFNQ
jgi:hypothetical protein